MPKIRRNPDVSCMNLKGRKLKVIDTFSYLGRVVIAVGKFRIK